jgi:hypothetical protein
VKMQINTQINKIKVFLSLKKLLSEKTRELFLIQSAGILTFWGVIILAIGLITYQLTELDFVAQWANTLFRILAGAAIVNGILGCLIVYQKAKKKVIAND